MKLVVQGTNIDVTAAIHDYVQQKLDKAVSHYQSFLTEIDVHLSVAKHAKSNPRQTAEVTIYANGTVIRAEECNENLYASIDLVSDKITRQLKKYKEKLRDRKGQLSTAETADQLSDGALVTDLLNGRQPELPQDIVRTKYFAMPAMTVEDALAQLQLVDHDFYMFRNAATGEINVIYERNHGGYGVIQPRPEGNSEKAVVVRSEAVL
ncbi:ribosome hibernation-promoting factor, HPF/YfiA family [Synechococcus elongatus]|uniref:Ribosome hibernation promoting factor n=1 Tax=Synechococcus elongatus (strain ATCC 33912 / PCC 7942 / FACHB-805) TaxID=1140 RepID=Q31KN7_SYNE7|nr:ribosome-associated translation inhibitor RaiA [Synechococcus elongatus]ABB58382.1 sigma 54 modulation protein / SSU ribosomal protein S30P [Synechococcus elongatus PCC 7942 = FACHB-805]AJD57154.1 Light-repressed protein A [Synechococcus elongatus UTEX 2973]MBD2587104.1 ribosome-associated translation inhibitor RaiA [Synechococcus elongatus FACHB-242]MBD2688175.1 ribosome-associated translation inhibitor RaiA [Synechococcus elongatus FACHB-1061]MBD2706114.1 ribosome-associated translation i